MHSTAADKVLICLKPHLNQVLTVAEVVLAGDQFKAFRRLVLKEFGRDGFEAELTVNTGVNFHHSPE